MRTTLLRWVNALVIASGLFGFGFAAQAGTVEDPLISNVSVSNVSSAAKGVEVSFTLSFTLTDTLEQDNSINVNTPPVNCTLASWDDCYINLQNSTGTGLSNATYSVPDDSSSGYATIRATADMPAGSYSVTISGAVLPDMDGANRIALYNSQLDWSLYQGQDVKTVSDPIIVGNPLAKGVVTDPDGNPLNSWAEVHNEDWSVQQGFNSDDRGFYVVSNPGFVSGDIVTITAHPDESLGLFTTTDTFTYSGSTVTKNIQVTTASKTISGSVTYADDGAPVTNANVYASAPGVWRSQDTDENGAYTLTLAGGKYDVCVGSQWDQETGRSVAKDWYMPNGQECEHVSFDDTDAEETATVDIVVNRADARIIGVFQNPDGSVPNGGWVSFWKDNLWFGGNVSSDDGSFDIAVVGGTNSVIATTLRARAVGSTQYSTQYSPNSSDEHTYWDTTTVTVQADQTLDLGTIVLSERDVVVNATVVDQDGNPVPNIYVDAWQQEGGWNNAQTDENGVATLYLYAGKWNLRPSVWNTTEYIYAERETQLTLAAGEEATVEFALTNTTLTVNMSVKDENGFTLGVRGWANCWTNNGGGGFGGQVENGTGSFGAVGGEYNCNLWVDDPDYQSSGDQQATFVDGENITLTFSLRQRTATATVNVKDSENNLISATNAHVYAHSDGAGWTDVRLDDNPATLRLASGNYRFGVWFEDGSQYIFGWGSEKEKTIQDGDTVNVTLTVQEVTGNVTAHLSDSDGEPVSNAWVGCGNWRELEGKPLGDFDGGRIIESGSQSGRDGVAVVGLVTGHEYECWVGVNSEYSDLIGPQSQQVSLTKKASTVDLDFAFQNADSEMNGTVSFADSTGLTADDIQNLWCNAWAEEGYNSWDDSFDNEFRMNAVAGTWHVWCGTDVVNENGDRVHYDTQGDTRIKLQKGDTKTIELVLRESLFDHIPASFTETFDATQDKTIALEDGTVVTIPANAIAQSGNVTVTAEPEDQAKRTYTDSPFGYPWNFEAYDSTGALVSGNFASSVTITIPYDEGIVTELGLTEDNLLPKIWDESLGAWTNVGNATQDTEANVMSFTVEHFSQYGITYNNRRAQADAPNRPRSVSVSDVTASSALVKWQKKGDTAVTKYKVQWKKKGAKKSKWKMDASVTKKQKRVKRLNADTQYSVRVRACNTAGCSKWTSWTPFTTAE